MQSGDGKRALVVVALLVLVRASVFLIWDRSFRQATAHYPGTSCPSVVQPGSGLHGSEVLFETTCGQRQLVRSLIDGIHLTDEGARLYGQQTAHVLSAQTGLLTSPKPC